MAGDDDVEASTASVAIRSMDIYVCMYVSTYVSPH